MVNPYQTPPDAMEEMPPPITKAAIWFAGGWPAILAVGSSTGGLIMLGSYLGSALGLTAGVSLLILPFYLLNYAILALVRGVPISSLARMGGALLLTPLSMVVFVPVCFGGGVTISLASQVFDGGSANVVGSGVIMVAAILIGFATVAAVMARMIRAWVTKRLAVQNSAASTLPKPLPEPSEAMTVDRDTDPNTSSSKEQDT